MSQPISNRFGRRPGRGLRPWILLPKLIAVGLYFGGLAAVAVLWISGRFTSFPAIDPRRLLLMDQVGGLIRFLVVPSILAAVALGIALLLQHPRQFIRMRWLRVKLVTIVIFIPSAHLFLFSRMTMLRRAFAQHIADDSAARQFGIGLIAAIVVSIWIIILGRLKPRLGQNWARTFAAPSGGIDWARDQST